ncbi:MAG: hypothetical protein KGK07_16395 [Chloroflexota bacterium]|nr:hypothetical protein [Chloroflexota bacterium]
MKVQLTRTKFAEVATLREASQRVSAHTDGKSGDRWYGQIGDLRGAPVTNDRGEVVARVSYNGRVWSPDATTEVIP